MWAPSFVSAVTSAATVSALRPSAHDAPRVLFAALDALTWYLLANNVLLQVHQYPLAAVVVAAFLTRYALHAVFPSLTKDPTTDAVSSGIRRGLSSPYLRLGPLLTVVLCGAVATACRGPSETKNVTTGPETVNTIVTTFQSFAVSTVVIGIPVACRGLDRYGVSPVYLSFVGAVVAAAVQTIHCASGPTVPSQRRRTRRIR